MIDNWPDGAQTQNMRQQQTGNDVVQDSRTQRDNHTDVLMFWPARGPYARHLTIKTGYNFVPTHPGCKSSSSCKISVLESF